MGKSTHRLGAAAVFGLGTALWFGWGCAGVLDGSLAYRYFAQPPVDDAWGHKIEMWQARERAEKRAPNSELGTPAVASGAGTETTSDRPTDLRSKYVEFRQQTKRALALELAGWIQAQAKQHYVPDGPIDHWATLEETFRTNGDDCDGLDLIPYRLLLKFGYPGDRLYRAIMRRDSNLKNHMVTLWFEDPEDPWVIDPTGAMTSGMPRMSAMPEWIPIKVFSEDSDFTVRRQRFQTALTPTP